MIEIEIDEDIFLDVYKPIVGSDADIVFFWGGRDSGKTHHIAQELILECLESDYFRCILIKKTHESIKDSQWQTIKDIVEEWNLDHLFAFREHPLEIRCVNGNKFIARGCDNPSKMKSIRNPTHAWYEEMDQLTKSDHITVQTTLRNDKGRVKEYGSFNPECVGDYKECWLYQWVGDRYEHFREDRFVKIDKSEVKMVIEAIHTTYDDNPYCTDDRKVKHEMLAQSDPYYYEVYRRGRWGARAVQSPFARQFNKSRHVSTKAVFDPRKLIYISFDFNLDPFGFIFEHKWVDDKGFHVHQFDEGSMADGDLDKGLEWIMDKYGRYRHNFHITGDKMGDRRDFGQSDKASYYARIKRKFLLADRQIETHANPEHKNSRDDVNYVLYHFPDYIIHPDCRNTITDLQMVEADNYSQIIKKDRKKPNQRADHLDCKRYSINDTFTQKWIKMHQKA